MAGGNFVTWGALSVRASLFTNAFDTSRTDDVYLRAFGAAASGYQDAPPGMPFAAAVASRVEKAGQFVVQKYPGRVDLVLGPIPTQRVASSPLFLLNNPADALNLVQRAAVTLMQDEPVVNRIALAADFAKTSETQILANKVLLDILPFDVPLTEQVDFILQFTVRSDSKSAKDLKINNVMRWSANQAQQMTIPAYSIGFTQSASPAEVFYISQFVADVNTVPDARPIAGSEVGGILMELNEKVNQSRRGQWEGELWNR
jgi:hypothetical protein